MTSDIDNADELINSFLDNLYLVKTLSELARVTTEVPLGYQTLIEPDHPKLVHFVQHVVRPRLIDLGFLDLIDVPRNNLVIRVGTGETHRSLLIQNYTPTQHHNLMEDPLSGKVANAQAYGYDEPAVFGQGVSQAKAHQAVMLAVLKLLRDAKIQLRGTLYWAVNNEGRSSHSCSESILAVLEETPDFGIIQIGTDFKISLGNRGRVDVNVHIRGKATHSSTPEEGLSAIDGVNEFLNRLKKINWNDRHPLLGGRHAIAYKIRYEPLAPHTLPSDAYITIDRRMLPGDDPEAATIEIRDVIGDMSPYEVSIEPSVYMLPALVDPEDAGVLGLQRAHEAVHGREAETVYGQGSFDAGGPCSLGVPTVMYGATGGIWPLGDDFVLLSAVQNEARVLAHMIIDQLV